MFGQIFRDYRGGNTGGGKIALHVEARGDDGRLDRIKQIEPVDHAAKAVPALVGMQHPIVAAADTLGDELVGTPHFEPPRIAKFVGNLAHGAAKIQRFQDRFFDQRFATRRLHHRRRHVAGRDNGVLRRRRHVHQISLVESVPVELAMLTVLHQNLRRLRQTGQHFVRRLGGEHQRILRARPFFANGVHAGIKLMEAGVGQPGFVEQQRVDGIAHQFLNAVDVVQHAVVGALRQCKYARLAVEMGRERVRGDAALNIFRMKFRFRNRPDDAVVVARRRQENRNRAGHGNRVQDRLVAVAIDDHDIIGRDGRVPHDLVRRRGAVGDKKQMVSAKDARRVAL